MIVDYESCPNFYEIFAELKMKQHEKFDGFVLHNGHLFLGCKLCIPRTSLKKKFIWELHNDGLALHFGNENTIKICRV